MTPGRNPASRKRVNPPLLVRSPLTGRIYIMTRYKMLEGGRYEAQTKWDVTEQFHGLAEQIRRENALGEEFVDD